MAQVPSKIIVGPNLGDGNSIIDDMKSLSEGDYGENHLGPIVGDGNSMVDEMSSLKEDSFHDRLTSSP